MCPILSVKLIVINFKSEFKKKIICGILLMYREHKKKLVVTEKKLKALQRKQKVCHLAICY